MSYARFGRRTASVALALLVTASALAGGCGSRPEREALTIAVESMPKSLDPRLGSGDGVSARIHQLVYDTLVRKNERFEFVGSLAESIEQSPDAKLFTFKLRDGVTFHNGQPFTSADVKYTFDTIRSPELKSPVRAAFDRLEAIETPDARTVIFRARAPYYGLLGDLVAVGIIASGTGPTQVQTPVGTGPFRVVAHDEQTIDLEANPSYFLGAPGVGKLQIKVVPDNTTRELEMQNGDVDLAINSGFSPDTVKKMQSDPDLTVVVAPGTNIDYVGINSNDEFMRDPRVRRAVACALDRDTIINTLLQGQARAADAMMPPEAWAYNTNVATYPHDLGRAKTLLDEASHPDPDGDGPRPRFSIKFTTTNIGLAPLVGQIVQEQLKAVGIAVELEQFERSTFFERLDSGQFAMFYARTVGGNQSPDVFQWAYHSRFRDAAFEAASAKVRTAKAPAEAASDMDGMLAILERRGYCPSSDADALVAQARAASDPAARRTLLLQVYDLIASRGAANRGRYCNPYLDQTIVTAERAPDRAEQKRLFDEVQRVVADEVPQIYLWYPATVAVARARVGNINVDPAGSWYFVRELTLKQ